MHFESGSRELAAQLHSLIDEAKKRTQARLPRDVTIEPLIWHRDDAASRAALMAALEAHRASERFDEFVNAVSITDAGRILVEVPVPDALEKAADPYRWAWGRPEFIAIDEGGIELRLRCVAELKYRLAEMKRDLEKAQQLENAQRLANPFAFGSPTARGAKN